MRLRLRVGAVAVGAAFAVAACDQANSAPPAPVPNALAPTAVLNGSLHFYLNTAPNTLAAFQQDKKDALISDGKLWEIRRADRLIGTLEIATVKPSVNLAKSKVRDNFTKPILIGATSDIRLGGQEVSTLQSDDGVSTIIWFGRGLFEVLQLKDTIVTGPQLAQAIIQYQQTRPEWSPLPQLYTPA
jgi:hypothetical protein